MVKKSEVKLDISKKVRYFVNVVSDVKFSLIFAETLNKMNDSDHIFGIWNGSKTVLFWLISI